MEGLQVLDLFGGTGAISYEFASRGASMVYCVEMLPLHANFIKSQAAAFGMRNHTGAEFPPRNRQIVQHLVIGIPDFLRGKSAVPGQLHGFNMGIVKRAYVNGQSDGHR